MGFLTRFRKKQKQDRPWCSAVVPAAGSGARMGGQDKLLLPLGDFPVLVHTLRALDESVCIHEIVVVTRQDLIVPIGQLCKDYAFSKVTKVIVGGDSRAKSVLAGVREVNEKAELIAVHDGARPLVTSEVIDAAVIRAQECGAAAPAVPVKDTIKVAVNGVVQSTPDRATLFAIQTPQVFQADILLGALTKAIEDGESPTDDCAAVERIGFPVALTEGSDENIKITTPTDLAVAEGILNGRDSF